MSTDQSGQALAANRRSLVGVIDYDAGNAPSVVSALAHLGHESRLVTRPSDLEGVDRIVLPGVGSAQATMDSLGELGLLGPLAEHVLARKVPFLGICVGLQILFEHSEEGDVVCLGWLRGRVRRYQGAGLRVPQIGWNTALRQREHALLRGLPASGHYYFVNSYYVEPAEPRVVLCATDYGVRFASMVAADNLMAAQFHVEKSGPLGLRILDNFARSAVTELCGA
ncbi:MAG TPA: imidazole glycerol phosphate synthase subunit HisH [Polyangiaceae bacterium]|nr:imidazole glycerol phosphate synthase subunit HisH [Polyangiaceae bacterium]